MIETNLNNKLHYFSYGYGSETDKRTPYFAYKQILNELFHVLNEKYYLTGRLEVMINQMKSRDPNFLRSEEKLSTSRSNSLLYDVVDDDNTLNAKLKRKASTINNTGVNLTLF